MVVAEVERFGPMCCARIVVAHEQRIAREAGLAGVFAWELSQDNDDILNAMNFGVGNLVLQP